MPRSLTVEEQFAEYDAINAQEDGTQQNEQNITGNEADTRPVQTQTPIPGGEEEGFDREVEPQLEPDEETTAFNQGTISYTDDVGAFWDFGSEEEVYKTAEAFSKSADYSWREVRSNGLLGGLIRLFSRFEPSGMGEPDSDFNYDTMYADFDKEEAFKRDGIRLEDQELYTWCKTQRQYDANKTFIDTVREDNEILSNGDDVTAILSAPGKVANFVFELPLFKGVDGALGALWKAGNLSDKVTRLAKWNKFFSWLKPEVVEDLYKASGVGAIFGTMEYATKQDLSPEEAFYYGLTLSLIDGGFRLIGRAVSNKVKKEMADAILENISAEDPQKLAMSRLKQYFEEANDPKLNKLTKTIATTGLTGTTPYQAVFSSVKELQDMGVAQFVFNDETIELSRWMGTDGKLLKNAPAELQTRYDLLTLTKEYLTNRDILAEIDKEVRAYNGMSALEWVKEGYLSYGNTLPADLPHRERIVGVCETMWKVAKKVDDLRLEVHGESPELEGSFLPAEETGANFSIGKMVARRKTGNRGEEPAYLPQTYDREAIQQNPEDFKELLKQSLVNVKLNELYDAIDLGKAQHAEVAGVAEGLQVNTKIRDTFKQALEQFKSEILSLQTLKTQLKVKLPEFKPKAFEEGVQQINELNKEAQISRKEILQKAFKEAKTKGKKLLLQPYSKEFPKEFVPETEYLSRFRRKAKLTEAIRAKATQTLEKNQNTIDEKATALVGKLKAEVQKLIQPISNQKEVLDAISNVGDWVTGSGKKTGELVSKLAEYAQEPNTKLEEILAKTEGLPRYSIANRHIKNTSGVQRSLKKAINRLNSTVQNELEVKGIDKLNSNVRSHLIAEEKLRDEINDLLKTQLTNTSEAVTWSRDLKKKVGEFSATRGLLEKEGNKLAQAYETTIQKVKGRDVAFKEVESLLQQDTDLNSVLRIELSTVGQDLAREEEILNATAEDTLQAYYKSDDINEIAQKQIEDILNADININNFVGRRRSADRRTVRVSPRALYKYYPKDPLETLWNWARRDITILNYEGALKRQGYESMTEFKKVINEKFNEAKKGLVGEARERIELEQKNSLQICDQIEAVALYRALPFDTANRLFKANPTLVKLIDGYRNLTTAAYLTKVVASSFADVRGMVARYGMANTVDAFARTLGGAFNRAFRKIAHLPRSEQEEIVRALVTGIEENKIHSWLKYAPNQNEENFYGSGDASKIPWTRWIADWSAAITGQRVFDSGLRKMALNLILKDMKNNPARAKEIKEMIKRKSFSPEVQMEILQKIDRLVTRPTLADVPNYAYNQAGRFFYVFQSWLFSNTSNFVYPLWNGRFSKRFAAEAILSGVGLTMLGEFCKEWLRGNEIDLDDEEYRQKFLNHVFDYALGDYVGATSIYYDWAKTVVTQRDIAKGISPILSYMYDNIALLSCLFNTLIGTGNQPSFYTAKRGLRSIPLSGAPFVERFITNPIAQAMSGG